MTKISFGKQAAVILMWLDGKVEVRQQNKQNNQVK
jgi:hypothetical protein